MFRTSALRPALYTAPRVRKQVRFATQDYGSGEGNPAGEKPQQQGTNPRSDLEHPGPPPPKSARNEAASSSSSDKSHPQGTSQAQPSTSSGSTKQGNDNDHTVKGAQPKILSENPPGEYDESVRQHNEEMDKRAEKAHEQISNEDAEKDKVPPGYWKGQG